MKNNRVVIVIGFVFLVLVAAVLLIRGVTTPPPSKCNENSASQAPGSERGGPETTPDTDGGRGLFGRSSKRIEPRNSAGPFPLERPLSRTPNPSSLRCLQELVSAPVEADRVRAAMLLGKRAGEEGLAKKAVPALMAALEHDEAPQVWLVAAQALGRYGGDASAAVPALLQWFDHPTMRDVAIDALGAIGPDAADAVESIVPIIRNPDERFISRRKAIEALVKIGEPGDAGIATVLEDAATDPDARIELAITHAWKIRLAEAAAPGDSQ